MINTISNGYHIVLFHYFLVPFSGCRVAKSRIGLHTPDIFGPDWATSNCVNEVLRKLLCILWLFYQEAKAAHKAESEISICF